MAEVHFCDRLSIFRLTKLYCTATLFLPDTHYFLKVIFLRIFALMTQAVFYYRTECMKAWSYSTAYVTTNGLQIHLLYFFWTRRISLKKKSRRALSLYAIQNMQVFYFLIFPPLQLLFIFLCSHMLHCCCIICFLRSISVLEISQWTETRLIYCASHNT